MVSWNSYSTLVIPGTVASGRSWSGYAVGNLRFSGCPGGIGVAQLSISFQSGCSLDAAVSTSSPVYPVWPLAPGATQRCFSSGGEVKNSTSIP